MREQHAQFWKAIREATKDHSRSGEGRFSQTLYSELHRINRRTPRRLWRHRAEKQQDAGRSATLNTATTRGCPLAFPVIVGNSAARVLKLRGTTFSLAELDRDQELKQPSDSVPRVRCVRSAHVNIQRLLPHETTIGGHPEPRRLARVVREFVI